MRIADQLTAAIAAGVRFIGQIEILPATDGAAYVLRHLADAGRRRDELEVHDGPDAARELSTWAEDGHYRFTKGELTLRRGWWLRLADAGELRDALDGFYPAAVGLWLAERDGRLEVQHLRDKLERQTGMYRFARTISDEGAQRLVIETCGPGHCCVKKILWRLDANTPLADSEASRYPGRLPEISPAAAIPLLCREACNHFVAECRKAAKEENLRRQQG